MAFILYFADTSEAKTQVVDVNRKRSPRCRRTRLSIYRTKRWVNMPKQKVSNAFICVYLKHLLFQQKSPTKKKILRIFEKILAQTLKPNPLKEKTVEEKKEELASISVDQIESVDMRTMTTNEKNECLTREGPTAVSSSSVIHPTTPIISQSTLSYEDQNFSYDIDLLASDIIDQDTIYHQPQDNIFQAQDKIFQTQTSVFDSQDASVCIPVMPDHQVPLQLPLSYMQRPSIFVPVTFHQDITVPEVVSAPSTFSILTSPTEAVATNPNSLKTGIKQRRVNLKRKCDELQQVYDTDGLALQPNLQTENESDILEHLKTLVPLPYIKNDQDQNSSKKFKKQIPKFRENNNWIGKTPKQEIFFEERPRQKVKLKISFCKKINLIKDIQYNRRKLKALDSGVLSNGDDTFAEKEEVVGDNGYDDHKTTISESDLITDSNYIKYSEEDNDARTKHSKTISKEKEGTKEKAKVNGKSDGVNKASKKKLFDFEDQKYEMDAKLIESYFRNQTKLKVINKWKIEPFVDLYDKSNDKNLRRLNKIRTSMVDLSNVLESQEGKFYYPQEVKYKPKKKGTCLNPLRKISKLSALSAVEYVGKKYITPVQNTEQVVANLLDSLIERVQLYNTRYTAGVKRRKEDVTEILDSIVSTVVWRSRLHQSKQFQ